MTSPFASLLFRVSFTLAGFYNLAFGAWAGFLPHHFFDVFEIDQPRYPQIWACLGMVVGIYGLLYWHAAWKLETGWPIIALGLLGKVLGPVGMILTFSDEWPRRLAMLNLYNDAIWWLPFSLFLIRDTRFAQRIVSAAPWVCAGLHLAALIALLLVLRHGMLTVPTAVERASYIADETRLWTVGWCVWMASAVSLVGFYAWWGSKLNRTHLALVGVVVASIGSVFDLSGESHSILVLVERALMLEADAASWDQAAFEFHERVAVLLTAGVANLLYCLGGFALMVRTPDLSKMVRLSMWATWVSGVVMTLSAVFNHVGGMVASTAVLFPLLIGWVVWMATRWDSLKDSIA